VGSFSLFVTSISAPSTLAWLIVVVVAECVRMAPDKTKEEIGAALSALSADPSLGYLAVTAKPENPIRDRVAWHFHQNFPSLIAAREYTVNSERNPDGSKRVDLALLELNDAALRKVALVEFKAMIAPDPLSNQEHPLMVSLVGDLEKLRRLSRVPRFGVMLMVHIEDVERLIQYGRAVKFMDSFRRWAKEPDALEKAIEITSEFFDRATFNVSPLTINLGSVWGAGIKLTSFILEPR